jgi:dipeptide/tripeptide permease
MIVGTAVMAAPTFILALGPSVVGLFAFVVLMTIGEAIWQPRFLQYAAEIAPKGRTGAYMGVAQFPWFLTKVFVPLYSGWFLQRYCPETGVRNTGAMWLVFGAFAMLSTVMLILARGWLGKDFKTKHA